MDTAKISSLSDWKNSLHSNRVVLYALMNCRKRDKQS